MKRKNKQKLDKLDKLSELQDRVCDIALSSNLYLHQPKPSSWLPNAVIAVHYFLHIFIQTALLHFTWQNVTTSLMHGRKYCVFL